MPFPKSFVWGAAAASYQIEGAHEADGKGPSVWDMMCRWPGKLWQGRDGYTACDHYHRSRQDVALMKQVGLKAYRLSVSWPRVMPQGVGAVNDKGLAFYDRLIDDLLAAGVQPWVTLFHWDYPLALFYRGGWLNRESVEWFAQYTQVIVDKLGDRVTNWMTLNEPQCFIGLGHGTGIHAPGIMLPMREQLLAMHHALMAHGRAVQVIRSRAKSKPTIGWAPVGVVRYPANDDPRLVEAARQQTMAVRDAGFWNNTWLSDPAIRGHYPEDGLKLFGPDVPANHEADMALIRQPLDFYGANIYNGTPIEFGPDGNVRDVQRGDGHPLTLFYWTLDPAVLYWGPRFLYERYKLPLVVTENGLSNPDWVDLDGRVRDPQRIDFTRRYLLQLERAVNDGIDVRGYMHWSIMDNFEWAETYKQRFGMIHVDYVTQQRTLKDSAHWYTKVIASNGAHLHEKPA
jgi:beta-glucosidase